MTDVSVSIFLEDDDPMSAVIMDSGTLAVSLGLHADLYVQSDSKHYARFVEMFMQKNTAPGGEAEDGGTDDTVQPEAKDGLT